VIAASTVNAQDYCKQIKKEVTDKNTNFSYETPYNIDSLPMIRLTRSYSTNPEQEFDNFSIVFMIPCMFGDLLGKDEAEISETKLVIEFDDKTKYTNDTLSITHDYSKGDGTAMRLAYLPITIDNVKSFTGKKITKFHLASANQAVPNDVATAAQQWAICLEKVRKL
jgi:hypothetical protein